MKNRIKSIQRSFRHAVRQVQPELWQIEFHHPVSTNCWLVGEPDGLTLIDAAHPWSANLIVGAIELIGRPLRRIVVTHGHPDHAGAAAELAAKTGAVVMAHEAEFPYLQGKRSMAHDDGYWLSSLLLRSAKGVGALDPPPIEHLQPIADGELVGRLQVVYTPGHTPGSISLWAETEKAIFCGDNIVYFLNALRLGMPMFTLDLEKQNKSLQRYAELPAQLLLSGHGPAYSGDVRHALGRLLK